MIKPIYLLSILALSALCIYLFVRAPEPLPEEGIREGQTIPIDAVFRIVAAENDVVRAQWARWLPEYLYAPGLQENAFNLIKADHQPQFDFGLSG